MAMIFPAAPASQRTSYMFIDGDNLRIVLLLEPVRWL